MAKRFIEVGDWALGADEVQWILLARNPGSSSGWRTMSFVSSTRDILARCIGEKGADAGTAAKLLDGLPSTFNEWKTHQRVS